MNKSFLEEYWKDFEKQRAAEEVIRDQIDREKRNIRTLEEYILWYLGKFENRGSDNLNAKSVINFYKILNGCKDDVLIFDNRGGCIFDIWMEKPNESSLYKFIQHLKENDRGTLLAYRIDGITTIENFKWLPSR